MINRLINRLFPQP